MAEEIKTTVVVGTVSGIAIISVALRFYVRIRLKVGVAWDDWWIFTGLVLTFLTGGLLLWGIMTHSTQILHLKTNDVQASA